MKKMTSEKKHKITTIGLWLILILCTAVLFSLCLSEGIDYDEAYSYRTAHDNTMMGIIRVVLAAHGMVYGIAAVVVSGRRRHYCLQNVCIAGNGIVHAAGACCDPQAVGSEDSSPLYDHGKPDTCNDEDQCEQQNVFLDGVWSYRLRTDRLFPAGAAEQ